VKKYHQKIRGILTNTYTRNIYDKMQFIMYQMYLVLITSSKIVYLLNINPNQFLISLSNRSVLQRQMGRLIMRRWSIGEIRALDANEKTSGKFAIRFTVVRWSDNK